MSRVIVATFENKRDADFIAGMIKRFRKNARVLKGEKLEDVYLGEMIEEGMQDEHEISEEEFAAFLNRKIKSLE